MALTEAQVVILFNVFSKLQLNSFFETNLLPELPQTLQAPSLYSIIRFPSKKAGIASTFLLNIIKMIFFH